MESCALKAVGVWFRSRDTGRYLYLLRNDAKHPGAWGLPGGKIETGETLPLEKFTSADQAFEYHTWVCVIDTEFTPRLNHEHLGYAWLDAGTWPKPMHPGLWSTINLEAVQSKILLVEQDLATR